MRVIGVVFSGIGILVLGVGVAIAVRTQAFLQIAETTPGTVVELIPRTSTNSDGKRSRLFYPLIEFEFNGDPVRFQANSGSNPSAFQPGDSVSVIYDPDRPDRASLHSFWGVWLATVLLVGIGIVFTAIGLVSGFVLVKAL